jgi:hypothetical protein
MDIKSVKLKDGYILRELGGEFCICYEHDMEQGSLLGMPSVNEACLFLWSRLQQGTDVSALIRALSQKYDMEEDEAEYEVAEFLAKLMHGKIIDYQ